MWRGRDRERAVKGEEERSAREGSRQLSMDGWGRSL